MSFYDEVVSLLGTTGFTSHEGHVPPKPTFPYHVLWFPPGRRSINSLEHTSGRLDIRFRVNSVGLSGQSVRLVAEAVESSLLDVRVTVAGWETYPIRSGALEVPIQEDRDVVDSDTNLYALYTTASFVLAAERS